MAVPIIRVCPEHLCRLFEQNHILERTNIEGQNPDAEFIGKIDSKRKNQPLIDHHGNECWITDLLFIVDSRFPQGDPRHEIANEVNRHRTDDGVVGGSGRWDPGKSHLQIDGTVYGRFQTKRGRAPHCALCEGGDMISIEERFIDSIYRPQ
jgi:hypothetical protein